MTDEIRDKLKSLPDSPGVYKMYNGRGQVIYVGKAINLKNRVRQYFRTTDTLLPKVAAMVSHVTDLDYIIASNETEALTLESNLIKEFKPHYNILLKDDKQYPYVRLDLEQDFPVLQIVRRVKNDGAEYFGPYVSGMMLRESMNVIRVYFPVRHCRKDIKKAIARRERPCIMYNIGKCCAPCSGRVTREEYHKLLGEVTGFLQGNTAPLISLLSGEMAGASEAMEYEKAARYRDAIAALRYMQEKQQAIASSDVERDVFALAQDDGMCVVFGLFIRSGKVIGTEKFTMAGADEAAADIMASFLKQYYSGYSRVPREVCVSILPTDAPVIELWLRGLRGGAVKLISPVRGDKKHQVELAFSNGEDIIRRDREQRERVYERGEGALAMLSAELGLESVPSRIECYDNSHIQGTAGVGGMVVFCDGRPAPKEYRRFRLESSTGGDDYDAMRQVLTRRFTRALDHDERFEALPELIIVDGGRGQLNVALDVLDSFDLPYIPVVGLAEKNEEIILPYSAEPLVLARNSASLHLMQRIRDEAHRFAISYHRNVRARNALYSVLDSVSGIGEKRKRGLYDRFVTLADIKAASAAELAAAPGMNSTAAEAVYGFFHGGENDEEL